MNSKENGAVVAAPLQFTERNKQSMNNSIVPYSGDNRQPEAFDFNGYRVTIKYDDDGSPMFFGPDICRIVELSNASRAYDRLDDDEKVNLTGSNVEHTGSGRAPVWVNESGLYSLIMQSRKPAAKAFKKWITSEVLPAIRKTGSYSLQTLAPDELLVVLAQQNVDMRKRQEASEREVAELREQQAQTNIELENINEKLLDRDFMSIETWCKVQGIKEGMRSVALRAKWGREASQYSRERSIPIRQALDELHVPGRYHVSVLQAVCVPRPRLNGQMTLIGGAK